jgi:ATP/maltotriose-dependent transcriptional regulator MalT
MRKIIINIFRMKPLVNLSTTGGWITGMVLSNLPGMSRVSGVDTFAYLGQQVLDQQPAHIREFLMRTSLPEEFNADFCETVLGPLHTGPQTGST